MIIYFADRFCNVIHTASTKSGIEQLIIADETTATVETGVKTLELTLVNSGKLKDVSTPGNLIMLRTENRVNELYIIIERTFNDSSNEISIYCEDAGMELLTTTLPAWTPKESQTINQCLQNALGTDYRGWTIPDDVKNSTVKKEKDALQFSDDETILSRLKTIVSLYEYEMYFSYDIDGFSVIKRNINIVKKIGKEIPTHTFTYGVEISKISEKGTIENLSTSFTLYGVNKKGSEKALKDLEGYKDLVGSTGIVIKPDDTSKIPTKRKHAYKVYENTVSCVEGFEMWKSTFNQEGNLNRIKKTNYKTAKEAIEYAIREIEKVVEGEWTYEIEFSTIQNDISVGDYIKIVDENENLYLQSRVVSIKKSEINRKMTVEISDTTKLKSSKPEALSILDSDICSITITSSSGLSSNNTFQTTLRAFVVINGSPVSSLDDLDEDYYLQWYENGEIVNKDDPRIFNNGFEFRISVDKTSTYMCNLIRRDVE